MTGGDGTAYMGEATMTSAQKRKDTMLKKKYDDSDMKKNMIAQYGKEEGTKIYFAKIRKEAMKEDNAIDFSKIDKSKIIKGPLKGPNPTKEKIIKGPLKGPNPMEKGKLHPGARKLSNKGEIKEAVPLLVKAAMLGAGMVAKKALTGKKKKKEKEEVGPTIMVTKVVEELDKKDKPFVKKLVKKLRKGSKTHAKQADDLEKAMKENTAIESELVIQDWNSDDIKFTEIETIDIIKAKPLKENDDLYEGFKTRMLAKFGKTILKNIGKVNPFTKTGAQRVTQGAGITKKYIPPDKVTSQNIQTKSVINQAKKMVDLSKKPNKGTKAVKVDLSKPIDFDKYLDKSQKSIKKKFIDKRPTGTFTDDLPPANNPKGKNPLKDHYDWRTEIDEDWQKVNRKDKTDGLSKAAVKAYRRENPGSKLQTAVTKDPKKLKKGSKSAKRRLSFCRRMKGMKKKLTSAKTRRDPDSRINKALRRWNC